MEVPSDLIAIAKIVRTRGLRGEVVADVLTDFPERFDGLESLRGLRSDGTEIALTLENHWFQNGRIVLKLAGYDIVESSEMLRDLLVCVPESESVSLQDGEFFDWQLEGCVVRTADGSEIGAVKGLMRTGGTEILVVTGGMKEYLIPFAASICTDVDIEAKEIVVDPPEGLLEF
ncbi:MAG: ribosome maturation factor RimM [Pyrinomonadaceae bacterium]